MGFLSSIFGGAKELNKIGNGVANITDLLDQYERTMTLHLYICQLGYVELQF